MGNIWPVKTLPIMLRFVGESRILNVSKTANKGNIVMCPVRAAAAVQGGPVLEPTPPQSLIRVPEICLGGVAYLYEVLASLSDLSYGMEAKKEFRSWQLMKNTMSSTKRKSSRHMTM